MKQVFKEFLASYKIKPSDEKLAVLSNFALKQGRINYDFMIDVFKNRLNNKKNPPKWERVRLWRGGNQMKKQFYIFKNTSSFTI